MDQIRNHWEIFHANKIETEIDQLSVVCYLMVIESQNRLAKHIGATMKEATEANRAKEMDSIDNRESNVADIEQNSEKSRIRNIMVLQRLQFVASLKPCKDGYIPYREATLPASSWYNEEIAQDAIRFRFGDKVRVRFDGIEKNEKIFHMAIHNLPENCTMVQGLWEDLFDKEIQYKSTGIGMTLNEPPTINPLYDWIFHDLCQSATKEVLKSAARIISRNMKEKGVYFATCYFGGRMGRVKGGVDRIAKNLRNLSGIKSDNYGEIMAAGIEKYLQWYGWKGNIRIIHNVTYSGGKKGSSTMVTLGLGINLPESLITPVIENRQVQNQIRKAELNNHYYATKKNGVEALFNDGRGRPKGKGKKVKLIDKQQVKIWRKIYKRWAKGLDSKTIAKQLGLELQSVGSTIAHLSPVFAAKAKGIRKQLVDQALSLRAKRLGTSYRLAA